MQHFRNKRTVYTFLAHYARREFTMRITVCASVFCIWNWWI